MTVKAGGRFLLGECRGAYEAFVCAERFLRYHHFITQLASFLCVVPLAGEGIEKVTR